MTNYKQWDDLSDTERYAIQNYVEAAEDESAEESGSADVQEEELDSDVASSNIEEINIDPNKKYAHTDDNKNVTVYDDEGNLVYETSMEDWQENQNAYYAKFGLGPNE